MRTSMRSCLCDLRWLKKKPHRIELCGTSEMRSEGEAGRRNEIKLNRFRNHSQITNDASVKEWPFRGVTTVTTLLR
jgi:hypothetical protein